MQFSTLLATVRVALTEVVLAFLLHEGSTICNASDQFRLLCFLFLCRLCFSSIPTDKNPKVLALYVPTTNSCISTSIENWTHVYMNLFTQNSPYYHLLKYLLFLLKHSVYIYIYSFSSLSYDRSKASSKASCPHSAIQSFLLQMRVSSPFLKVIQ